MSRDVDVSHNIQRNKEPTAAPPLFLQTPTRRGRCVRGRLRALHTVEFTGVKKTGKIPQAFWYHGNVSLTLGNDLVASLKIYLYVQKRYGHPDMQILATLKQKIWIGRF